MMAFILSPHSDNLAIAKQLYWASAGGRDHEVLELLQRGAPPNNSDYYTGEHDGWTPLHWACNNNHLRSAELLIKFGAIVAAIDNYGRTPLHRACLFNSKAIAKLLLEHPCPTGEPAWALSRCVACSGRHYSFTVGIHFRSQYTQFI